MVQNQGKNEGTHFIHQFVQIENIIFKAIAEWFGANVSISKSIAIVSGSQIVNYSIKNSKLLEDFTSYQIAFTIFGCDDNTSETTFKINESGLLVNWPLIQSIKNMLKLTEPKFI